MKREDKALNTFHAPIPGKDCADIRQQVLIRNCSAWGWRNTVLSSMNLRTEMSPTRSRVILNVEILLVHAAHDCIVNDLFFSDRWNCGPVCAQWIDSKAAANRSAVPCPSWSAYKRPNAVRKELRTRIEMTSSILTGEFVPTWGRLILALFIHLPAVLWLWHGGKTSVRRKEAPQQVPWWTSRNRHGTCAHEVHEPRYYPACVSALPPAQTYIQLPCLFSMPIISELDVITPGSSRASC